MKLSKGHEDGRGNLEKHLLERVRTAGNGKLGWIWDGLAGQKRLLGSEGGGCCGENT